MELSKGNTQIDIRAVHVEHVDLGFNNGDPIPLEKLPTNSIGFTIPVASPVTLYVAWKTVFSMFTP